MLTSLFVSQLLSCDVPFWSCRLLLIGANECTDVLWQNASISTGTLRKYNFFDMFEVLVRSHALYWIQIGISALNFNLYADYSQWHSGGILISVLSSHFIFYLSFQLSRVTFLNVQRTVQLLKLILSACCNNRSSIIFDGHPIFYSTREAPNNTIATNGTVGVEEGQTATGGGGEESKPAWWKFGGKKAAKEHT